MKKILSLLAVAPLATACISSVEEWKPGQSYDAIVITNYNSLGQEVVQSFDSVPTRVIAEGQASVDLMAALGLGDLIVGSSNADGFEMKDEWNFSIDDANHIDGNWMKEDAMVLNPDFIMVHTRSAFYDTRLDEVDTWHDLGVGTFIMSSQVSYPLSIEKELDDILNIGKIFNVEEKAQTLIDEIKAELEDDSVELPDASLDVLVYEDWSAFNGFYRTYGTRTLAESVTVSINDRYRVLGTNMGPKDLETVSQEMGNPDIIIILNDEHQNGATDQSYIDATMNNAAFQDFDAVKNGNVFATEVERMYTPGVRVADTIKIFRDIFASYTAPDA